MISLSFYILNEMFFIKNIHLSKKISTLVCNISYLSFILLPKLFNSIYFVCPSINLYSYGSICNFLCYLRWIKMFIICKVFVIFYFKHTFLSFFPSLFFNTSEHTMYNFVWLSMFSLYFTTYLWMLSSMFPTTIYVLPKTEELAIILLGTFAAADFCMALWFGNDGFDEPCCWPE